MRRVADGRQTQVVVRELAAIPFRAARFDVDRAEQAGRNLPAVAFAGRRRRRAIHQVVAFLRAPIGVERVGDAATGRDETAGRVGIPAYV